MIGGLGVFNTPWALVGFFDLSFRVELLRFLIIRIFQEISYVLHKILKLALLIKTNEEQESKSRVKLTYNNAVSERVGLTISWRIKEGFPGTEFRLSPWASYFAFLPTVTKAFFGTETPAFVKSNELFLKFTQWLDQRTAAVGMSSARLPCTYHPQFTLNTYFNLNGFYCSPIFIYMRTYWNYLVSKQLSVGHVQAIPLDTHQVCIHKKEELPSGSVSSNSTKTAFTVHS